MFFLGYINKRYVPFLKKEKKSGLIFSIEFSKVGHVWLAFGKLRSIDSFNHLRVDSFISS